jgi:hypothetical protein
MPDGQSAVVPRRTSNPVRCWYRAIWLPNEDSLPELRWWERAWQSTRCLLISLPANAFSWCYPGQP